MNTNPARARFSLPLVMPPMTGARASTSRPRNLIPFPSQLTRKVVPLSCLVCSRTIVRSRRVRPCLS